MYKKDKWPYPSWSIDVVLQTEQEIEIQEVLKSINCLHECGIGYGWGDSTSPFKISLYAEKPKYISQRIFHRAISELKKNSLVKSTKELQLVNTFNETNFNNT